jgi:hypothetical protein
MCRRLLIQQLASSFIKDRAFAYILTVWVNTNASRKVVFHRVILSSEAKTSSKKETVCRSYKNNVAQPRGQQNVKDGV